MTSASEMRKLIELMEQIDHSTTKSNSRQLTEITRPSTINDAEEILLKANFRRIGTGTVGRVYTKPNYPYALKLFRKCDNAFIDFVKFTKDHPNQHFPKFGKIVKVSDRFFAVQTELLEPCPRDIAIHVSAYSSGEYDLFPEMIKDAEKFMTEHPSVKAACDLLEPLFQKHGNDLGPVSNIMMRNGVIVIIDPVRSDCD